MANYCNIFSIRCFTIAAGIVVMIVGSAVVCCSSGYDPMYPQVKVVVEDSENGGDVKKEPLHLQTVLVAAGRRVAVINGRTLNIGDQIGQYRLQSIDGEEVQLCSAEGDKKLQLHPNIIIHKQVNGAD